MERMAYVPFFCCARKYQNNLKKFVSKFLRKTDKNMLELQ